MERQNEKVKELSWRNTVVIKLARKQGFDCVAPGGPCQIPLQWEEPELVAVIRLRALTSCIREVPSVLH